MNTFDTAAPVLPGAVLEALHADLARDGVSRVAGLVPDTLCSAARAEIDRFGNFSADPDSWYAQPPRSDDSLPVHQSQAFWDIRQLPGIYELFRAVLGTPFLWVTLDGPAFRPPERAGDRSGRPFRWDVDPRRADRRVQGLVYLEDCATEQGAFRCVPGIYRNPEAWRAIHGVGPFEAERIRPREIQAVGGRRGDLVLWDARLPHGTGPNTLDAPSYSLPVTLFPEGDQTRRRERVQDFEDRRAPAFHRGTPGQRDPEPGAVPQLTDLGERLLGRLPW
jgi:hypothetical protein